MNKVIEIKKSTIAMGAIIAALLIYIILTSGPDSNIDKYAKQKQEIDSLNTLILGLEQQQLQQDSVIKSYQNLVTLLDGQIENQKSTITTIKQQYGQEINNIRSYTPAELDSFFTARYPRTN